MMKKRWLLVLSLMICAVLLLSACSVFNKAEMKKSQTNDSVEVTKLAALDGYTYDNESNGILAMFSKQDGETTVKKVIRFDTGAEVYSWTEKENEDLQLSNEMLILSKADEANDTVRYTVIDRTGTALCTDVKNYRFINDCLVYDYINVIRLDKKTGEVKERYTRSEFDGKIPSCDEWTEKYYYAISGRTVNFYDKHYVHLATYTMPGYVESIVDTDRVTYYVAADGAVIAQGKVKVDDQSEKYDYLQNGVKYNLFTVRVNPKNGKAQDLNVDVVLVMLINPKTMNDMRVFGAENVWKDSGKNLAAAYKIENQRLNQTEEAMVLMSVDSHLKGKELFMMNGETVMPEVVGNGYLLGEGSVTESTYLLSANGKILANLDAAVQHTEKYILTERAIYNYELKQLEDLSGKDYEFVGIVGNALIFKEAVTTPATGETPASTVTTYYLYDGTFKKIADDKSWGSNTSYYYTLKTVNEPAEGELFPTTDYAYYDATGKLLFTSIGGAAGMLASDEDNVLVQVKTADGYAFYRVQK